jgi:hypothetical protein
MFFNNIQKTAIIMDNINYYLYNDKSYFNNLIKLLKKNKIHKFIPFIFINTLQEEKKFTELSKLSYCLKIASFAALEWDGLANWFYKVQIFYQQGSLKDLNNVPYSFYPHLGAYIWAFFWKTSYTEYEYLGRFFYIIIFIISSLTISNRIKNEKIKIIFFVCFVLFLTEWTLFGGYQEYIV